MKEELIASFARIHTTPMGKIRINNNIGVNVDNIGSWIKEVISSDKSNIERKGKNYYVTYDDVIITINAYSFTIITAHRVKK